MGYFSEIERNKVIVELDFREERGANKSNHLLRYVDINSINLDINTPIYRIIPLTRFYEMLENQNNVLVKPHLWEDPFENFLLKATGKLNDGTPVSFKSIHDSFYAQCWTTKNECDGLWRNYKCSATSAIKIKTTISKLMERFYDLTNQFHTLSYFIGKVDYVNDAEIIDFFQDPISLMDFKDLGFVKTLLIKRKAFAYEEEVRLIFSRPNSNEINIDEIKNPWDNSDLFKFSIDPNDLIEEVEIDPWILPDDYKAIRREITAKGYLGNIVRSSLYDEILFNLRIK